MINRRLADAGALKRNEAEKFKKFRSSANESNIDKKSFKNTNEGRNYTHVTATTAKSF